MVIRCLQGFNFVNVNCINMLGRFVIQIVVDNENVELVEIFLQQDGVKIGDVFLYVIREGVYRIVEMFIDYLSISLEMFGFDWFKIKRRGEESLDYSLDICLIILVVYCNQFEIFQLIFFRGVNIEFFYMLFCSC